LLIGVTRYTFDKERHMLTSSFAKRAQYSAEKWELSDVTTTYFRNVGQGTKASTEVINVASEPWDIALKPELLNTVVMVPEA
ncbi:LPS export ABC transporter permease LptG, partial [Pseudomonas sp. SIMBA_068]